MARLKKTTVRYLLLLALYHVFLQVKADECYSNSGCPYSQYCCSRKYYYERKLCRHSCVGLSCNFDRDCASGEACCQSNDKCALNCIGKFCSRDSNCAPGESCCKSNYKCALKCIGESCRYDSDCASGESCCHSAGVCKTGGCRKSEFGWPGWLIAITVVSTVGLFILILVCAKYRRYTAFKRRSLRGVIVAQPMNTGATVLVPQRQQCGIPQQGQPIFQCPQPQGTALLPPEGHVQTPTY